MVFLTCEKITRYDTNHNLRGGQNVLEISERVNYEERDNNDFIIPTEFELSGDSYYGTKRIIGSI